MVDRIQLDPADPVCLTCLHGEGSYPGFCLQRAAPRCIAGVWAGTAGAAGVLGGMETVFKRGWVFTSVVTLAPPATPSSHHRGPQIFKQIFKRIRNGPR